MLHLLKTAAGYNLPAITELNSFFPSNPEVGEPCTKIALSRIGKTHEENSKCAKNISKTIADTAARLCALACSSFSLEKFEQTNGFLAAD